ncbi:MAG: ABC transporter ATP-binding protein [Thermoanaerobaculia bacterium]
MRISLRNVSHDYGRSEESAAVHVLDDVSLDIAAGDFAVLMGASGSGKSTLLNLMGAVERPTAGQVFLGDVETSALDERGLTQLRRTSLGFVFQFFNLIPTLKVRENVGFPLALLRTGRREAAERVDRVLDEVGLSHRADHYPNELSGGEMQRVAIGRAIVHRPALILADEPTGNLDSASGLRVLELIRGVHQALRPTIVMATHSDVAAAYGDYVIHVADGRASVRTER